MRIRAYILSLLAASARRAFVGYRVTRNDLGSAPYPGGVPDRRWTTALTAVGVVCALGLVVAVQYTPHLGTFEDTPAEGQPGLVQLGMAWGEHVFGDRDGHPWAIHVDEHFHASMVAQMQAHDRVIGWGPYTEDPGRVEALDGLRGAVHERGYHVFLVQVQDVTGIDTFDLYRYGPALWTALIAFGVFALVRPHPAAVPAAGFVALLPTSVRFMGTGFLVPIGVSLAWLPAVAMLSGPARKRTATAGLLLTVTTWAFFVHLMAGVASVALVLGAGLYSSGRARKAALVLTGVALIPVAWLYRSFSAGVQTQIQREESLPIDLTIFDNFGVLTLGLWALGIGLMLLDPPERDTRPAVAAVATLSVAALVGIVGTTLYDWNRYALYSRMHPIFFLTACVPAGFGVTAVARRAGRAISASVEQIARWLGQGIRSRGLRAGAVLIVGLALFVPTTSLAVSTQVQEPYYRVMEPSTWNAYNQVEETHNDEDNPYEVYLSHPWRSTFLFEKTTKLPHTVMSPGAPPPNGQDWVGYLQGDRGLDFYVNNDVTLVVGERPPPGDVWNQTHNRVWVMEEPYAEQIQNARNGEPVNWGALPDDSS
jgi:hypothetical protein